MKTEEEVTITAHRPTDDEIEAGLRHDAARVTAHGLAAAGTRLTTRRLGLAIVGGILLGLAALAWVLFVALKVEDNTKTGSANASVGAAQQSQIDELTRQMTCRPSAEDIAAAIETLPATSTPQEIAAAIRALAADCAGG